MKNLLNRFHQPALACVVLALVSVCPARAQSTAFTYNGRLTGNGAPVTGLYDMQFTLYDAINGNIVPGAGPLAFNSVGVTNGLFTVRIDFGPGKFTGPERWLDVAVRPAGGGAFTPLNPRQEVTSSPYSTRSQSAGTADSGGGGNDSVWSVTANNAHYDAGNVGVGTSAPEAKLHVIGGALRFEKDGKVLDLTAGTLTDITARNTSLVLQSLGGNGNNDVILNPFPNSGLFPNGNVGIGTFFPQNKLSVSGNADFSGNVGIGTTAPAAKMEAAATSLNGQAVRGVSTGANGFGVYGKNMTGGVAIGAEGNASQNRDKGGFVKAMIYVNLAGSIIRCHNSFLIGQSRFTGADLASDSPCGFSVFGDGQGKYTIDFGFQVSDRFISITPEYQLGRNFTGNFSFSGVNANQIKVVFADVTNDTYSPRDAGFMIVVY